MAITRVADTSFSTGAYGWAYAPNIIGLKGLTTEDKYVLQVWNKDGTSKLADIRVEPNAEGVAYIDISTVLQSQVQPKKEQIITSAVKPFLDSSEQTAELRIYWGSETDGVVTIDGQTTTMRVSRQRNTVQWLNSNELNTFSPIGRLQDGIVIGGVQYKSIPTGTIYGTDCTVLTSRGAIQTDWTYYKLGSELDAEAPFWVGNNPTVPVLMQKITRGSNGIIPYRSLSIYNYFDNEESAKAKGCEGVVISEYNGSTFIGNTFYGNTTANGGGPNSSIWQGSTIQYPYNYISFNWSDNQVLSNVKFNPDTTHFYVSFMVGTGSGCGEESFTNIYEDPAWLVTRYDVVEQCNDYSPFTLMWLNSKGFYDYFQFNKKHEESINIQRNPYLANQFDYNRPDITLSSYGTNYRGTTNYSQKITKQLTLTTDWLEDYEATFLKNLLMSPEVYYIDQDNWYKGRPSNPQYGIPIACQLLSNTYTEKTYRKNKLFQLEIKVQDSFNLNSQRG